MEIIIITTLVITLIGIIVGAGLVFAGKKFHVEVDERETAVRACLPGNNCGACGYAGCDAMAAAIVAGEAPVTGCPVGGQPVADAIGAVMGVSAVAEERKVAFVRCKGDCTVTRDQGSYIGIRDCRAAVLGGLNIPECDYGCLGLGSCVKACPQNAIKIVDGVAVVNRSRCIGCGLCAKACPKGLIELVPESKETCVRCSNKDKGPVVKKVCSAGCIGCSLCVRQCEQGAIQVENNLAHIDYAKCVQCGKCAEKCPAKVITTPQPKKEGVKRMEKKTQFYRLIGAGVVLALIIVAALGMGMYHMQNRGDLGPLTRSDIAYLNVSAPAASSQMGIVTAADWESTYPYITSTMWKNAENEYVTDYLEQDPYLKNIYEGYGFAKDYGSARGHEYCLTDVAKTLRPHGDAKCLTCKTPYFNKLVTDEGLGVYTMAFDEVLARCEESTSCYSCHGNDAGNGGQITIVHSYVNKALGSNVSTIDASTLSCGQCHIEYYFTPSDQETMMPYDSVAAMTPEAIYAYYESIDFADWTQASTGTRLLKAQHPEMETVLQGKHAALLNCADCHMPLEMADDGTVYHSHTLVSPLENETLLSTCAQCHEDSDMVNMVRRLQERVTARETEVGNELSEFKSALAAAVEAGKMTEEELNAVRALHREAQWYFDFCYVENSEGAHNSDLAYRCLDTAETLIQQGMALLA